jgi:hypothetical protein
LAYLQRTLLRSIALPPMPPATAPMIVPQRVAAARRNDVAQTPPARAADDQAGRAVRTAAIILAVLTPVDAIAGTQATLLILAAAPVVIVGVVAALAGLGPIIVVVAELPVVATYLLDFPLALALDALALALGHRTLTVGAALGADLLDGLALRLRLGRHGCRQSHGGKCGG